MVPPGCFAKAQDLWSIAQAKIEVPIPTEPSSMPGDNRFGLHDRTLRTAQRSRVNMGDDG